MTKFAITLIIDESPKNVWDAYINPQNMLQYTKYLEKVETVKGEFGEIGATAHLHYLEKGRRYILEDKLLEYEEGKRILSQVSGQGMIIKVETSFEPHSSGTSMKMSWNGTSKSLFARFILRLMQSKIAKHAKAELVTFKNLVETHGIVFPAIVDESD